MEIKETKRVAGESKFKVKGVHGDVLVCEYPNENERLNKLMEHYPGPYWIVNGAYGRRVVDADSREKSVEKYVLLYNKVKHA